MVKAASSPILQLIRRVAEDQLTGQLPDQELLHRFAARQDEAAFHTLLRRHGPMVLDVCRSALGNEADAEDAFQATFLIFGQKAASIRKAESLGSWLHGVAYRTALKARAQSTARRKHEASAPVRPGGDADDLSWREVREAVHEELSALPKCYRVPLVLCYLEGATQEDAAAQLRVARSTLKERLERGRAFLRARLVRRGLGPAALLIASAWPPATASAGLPVSLVSSTIKAATALAAGGAATTGVSAKVVALTEGVQTMFLGKAKLALVAVLAVSLLGTAAVFLSQAGPAGGQPEKPGADTTEAKRPGPDEAAAERARLQGEWVFDEATRGPQDVIDQVWNSRLTFKGNEVSITNLQALNLPGARLHTRFRLDPTQKPKHIDLELKAVTDLPKDISAGRIRGIYALEGDTLNLCLHLNAAEGKDRPADFKTPGGSDQYLFVAKRVPKSLEEGSGDPKEAKAIEVRLVDTEGKPLIHAKVGNRADFNLPGLGPEWTYWHQLISGEDGSARWRERREDLIGGWLVARHHGRRLVAIEKLTPARLLSGPVTLTMQPECRVSGRLTCPTLERGKVGLGWTCVALCPGDGSRCGPIRCAGDEQMYHFFVPPGTYTLYAYGDKVHSVQQTITVKPGQRELKVDPIEFPLPRRLAVLEGTRAPEFSEIAAWKNGPPLKLADLRGKCVLVVFWMVSCPPCLQEMPALFELHEKYRNEGLVVVGIHVDTSSDGKGDSVAKLDKVLTAAREKLWNGKDIPFPVALARHRDVRYGEDIHQKASCKVAADYGVTFYPTSILIDRRGTIVGTLYPHSDAGMAILKQTLAIEDKQPGEAKNAGARRAPDAADPLAASLLGAADAPREDRKKELQQLEGTWMCVSFQFDGADLAEDEAKKVKLILKGDSYEYTFRDGRVETGTIRLDSTKRPRTLDATPSVGPNAGRTFRAIYDWDGDSLKYCMVPSNQERPAGFVSRMGSMHTLARYQREKPKPAAK